MFNFSDFHLDGTLDVPYNLLPTRFIKSWNIIINCLCVYAFEFVCTPLNLSKVYSFWSIMNGLCVYAFECAYTQVNLCGVQVVP